MPGMPLRFSLFLVLFFATVSIGNAQTQHRVVIDVDVPGDTISRHLYGHFAEHLGRGIYGGLFQRDASGAAIVREDVAEALRRIQIPNLRWPGGCFADYYFWKDGVGPREDRPSIVNVLWGGVTEDNSVGTHEFMDLVEQLGTEPVIVGNVGSGTVRDMAQWWEYMKHPAESPMADWRRQHGRDDPWDVTYWGVGNESWGCGGNMRPEFYADQYRRFATFLHDYGTGRPFRIAAGAAGEDYRWTEVVMREAGHMIDGLDFHHYTILGTWAKKGHATDFTEAEWFELLERSLFWDELLTRHSAIMDQYDPQKRVWLIVGEWGTWHEQEEGSTPGFLYQQNTLRDALSAAVSLDAFHRHLDRVKMANIAQTVNVLQAMILTEGDRMLLTPTYHVFDFHTVHHDAVALPAHVEAGDYRMSDRSIPALSVSASRNAEGTIHLTLTNLDPNNTGTVETLFRGADLRQARGRILTAGAMNAHNTFETPEAVVPREFTGARLLGERLVVEMPPKSLVVLELR
ncbi:MAG: alpha-N-arabinofuranosidase [Bacteroidota bacterium]